MYILQYLNTVESFKFGGGNFLGLRGFLLFSWGYNFVDTWVFSFSRKTNSLKSFVG